MYGSKASEVDIFALEVVWEDEGIIGDKGSHEHGKGHEGDGWIEHPFYWGVFVFTYHVSRSLLERFSVVEVVVVLLLLCRLETDF